MKKTIAVIGEGITEKHYIESLKGLSPFDIRPKELSRNASSLSKLEDNIKQSINDGYDEVYCLIDMDGKEAGISKNNYISLKNKYHNITHGKKSKGIKCKVVFIETERCTELWFLFYFLKNSTTKKYNSYKELEKDLRKFRPDYEKSDKYFKSLGGIHKNFIEKDIKGNFKQAIINSEKSLVSRDADNRDYTYSEMHLLIEALSIDIK